MTKREKILEAALNLFIEKGFAKTPTSKISSEAGVATGTLFHHFKTKEDLINSLYLEIETQLFEEVSAGLEQAKEIKGKFHHIWKKYVFWAMDNQKQYQFIIRYCESPFITNVTQQQVENLKSQISCGILEEGKEQGILRCLPDNLIKSLAGGILLETVRHFMGQPKDLRDKELVAEIFEVFWCALAR